MRISNYKSGERIVIYKKGEISLPVQVKKLGSLKVNFPKIPHINSRSPQKLLTNFKTKPHR